MPVFYGRLRGVEAQATGRREAIAVLEAWLLDPEGNRLLLLVII